MADESVARSTATLHLRHDRSAGREPLQLIGDHAVAGFEAGKHDAIAIDLRTEFDTAILGLVALTDDKDKALALIIACLLPSCGDEVRSLFGLARSRRARRDHCDPDGSPGQRSH